jgi:hypothetical protein
MVSGRGSKEFDVDSVVSGLDVDELRTIVLTAAEEHEDVARSVRMAADRGSGDLAELRSEVDRGLRTRRYLGYWDSSAWAHEADPIIKALRDRAWSTPSLELLGLIERAVGHMTKVILRADDSNGSIGRRIGDLLDLHAQLCDAGVADPRKLARWMIRYGFEDQDFFAIDPVRYAAALGDKGLAVYRAEVEDRLERGDGSFHVQVAQERIAVLDGDIEAIVRLLGGDLSGPYHFIRVAKAMQELGRDDEVLAWAERGIEETTGWQVGRLYDLAAEVYASRGHLAERLALRRQQHVRMPSTRTYGLLRDAAEPTGSWSSEQGAARSLLAPGDLVDVLLGDGEPSAAWQVRIDNPAWDPGADRLMRLAEGVFPDEWGAGVVVGTGGIHH